VDLNSVESTIILPPLAKYDPVSCCSYCYYNMQGCNFWAAGNTFCFIVMNGRGPEASRTCPNGKGSGVLFVDEERSKDTSGGDGPCAGDYRKDGWVEPAPAPAPAEPATPAPPPPAVETPF
jgi:hypothetical protein